jgi:hypothetical protein
MIKIGRGVWKFFEKRDFTKFLQNMLGKVYLQNTRNVAICGYKCTFLKYVLLYISNFVGNILKIRKNFTNHRPPPKNLLTTRQYSIDIKEISRLFFTKTFCEILFTMKFSDILNIKISQSLIKFTFSEIVKTNFVTTCETHEEWDLEE